MVWMVCLKHSPCELKIRCSTSISDRIVVAFSCASLRYVVLDIVVTVMCRVACQTLLATFTEINFGDVLNTQKSRYK